MFIQIAHRPRHLSEKALTFAQAIQGPHVTRINNDRLERRAALLVIIEPHAQRHILRRNPLVEEALKQNTNVLSIRPYENGDPRFWKNYFVYFGSSTNTIEQFFDQVDTVLAHTTLVD